MRRSSCPFSMDRPLPTLLLFTWAIVFSHSPLLADSRLHDIRLSHHKHKVHNRSHFHSRSSHYSSAPSSSNLSPPPPPPVEHTKNHPPPGKPTHRQHHPPPPPPIHRNKSWSSPHNHHRSPIDHRHSTKRKLNIGKKIGLLFVGIAVSLQLAFGLFLGVKRWQISKMERRSS